MTQYPSDQLLSDMVRELREDMELPQHLRSELVRAEEGKHDSHETTFNLNRVLGQTASLYSKLEKFFAYAIQQEPADSRVEELNEDIFPAIQQMKELFRLLEKLEKRKTLTPRDKMLIEYLASDQDANPLAMQTMDSDMIGRRLAAYLQASDKKLLDRYKEHVADDKEGVQRILHQIGEIARADRELMGLPPERSNDEIKQEMKRDFSEFELSETAREIEEKGVDALLDEGLGVLGDLYADDIIAQIKNAPKKLDALGHCLQYYVEHLQKVLVRAADDIQKDGHGLSKPFP